MKVSYSMPAPEGVLFDGSKNRAKIEISVKFDRSDMNVYCYHAPYFDEDLCGVLALDMAYEYVLRTEKRIPFRFIVKRVFNWIIGGALARFASKHEIDPLELNENNQLTNNKTNNHESL